MAFVVIKIRYVFFWFKHILQYCHTCESKWNLYFFINRYGTFSLEKMLRITFTVSFNVCSLLIFQCKTAYLCWFKCISVLNGYLEISLDYNNKWSCLKWTTTLMSVYFCPYIKYFPSNLFSLLCKTKREKCQRLLDSHLPEVHRMVEKPIILLGSRRVPQRNDWVPQWKLCQCKDINTDWPKARSNWLFFPHFIYFYSCFGRQATVADVLPKLWTHALRWHGGGVGVIKEEETDSIALSAGRQKRETVSVATLPNKPRWKTPTENILQDLFNPKLDIPTGGDLTNSPGQHRKELCMGHLLVIITDICRHCWRCPF